VVTVLGMHDLRPQCVAMGVVNRYRTGRLDKGRRRLSLVANASSFCELIAFGDARAQATKCVLASAESFGCSSIELSGFGD
jgi:hypothetical protein